MNDEHQNQSMAYTGFPDERSCMICCFMSVSYTTTCKMQHAPTEIRLHQAHRPRIYPPAFADKIKELYPGLVKGGTGKPNVENDHRTGEQVFDEMAWSDWEEAELSGVLHYLRGNRHLVLPDSWRAVLPRPFEILFKLEQRAKRARAE